MIGLICASIGGRMLRRIAAAIAVTIFALLLRPAAAPAQAPAGSVVLPDLGILRDVAPACRSAFPADRSFPPRAPSLR